MGIRKKGQKKVPKNSQALFLLWLRITIIPGVFPLTVRIQSTIQLMNRNCHAYWHCALVHHNQRGQIYDTGLATFRWLDGFNQLLNQDSGSEVVLRSLFSA